MSFIEREFYRSPHGPTAADHDVWILAFDVDERRLYVRHEWHVRGNKGVEAFDIENGTRAWTYWTTPPDGMENGAMVWSATRIAR